MGFMERYRLDVESALKVWKIILEENLEIEYAYVKGSAVKPWENLIDYVPILSDVDIHVRSYGKLLKSYDPLQEAMKLNRRYQELFVDLHPHFNHIPRCQVMDLEKLQHVLDYIPPDYNSVRFIIGEKENTETFGAEKIRQIDKKRLEDDYQWLKTLPHSVLDRSGLDFWQLIRRLNWRVSPSVVRYLSQIDADPFSLWNFNRSSYLKRLREVNASLLSDLYEEYYRVGWQLYRENFKSDELARQLILIGSKVIRLSYESI